MGRDLSCYIAAAGLSWLLLCHGAYFGQVKLLSFQYVSTSDCHMMVQYCGCLFKPSYIALGAFKPELAYQPHGHCMAHDYIACVRTNILPSPQPFCHLHPRQSESSLSFFAWSEALSSSSRPLRTSSAACGEADCQAEMPLHDVELPWLHCYPSM